MKRLLPILLALLLLTGCGSTGEIEQTQPETVPVITEPAPVSLYDAASDVEQQTQGAVRAYPLGDGEYRALMTMGENLLLVSSEGILTLLEGQTGNILATEMTALPPDWETEDIVCGEAGVIYYSRENRYVVQLDKNLRQVLQVALPEESLGNPQLLGSGEVFYCTENQIRALNLETGLTRLVREHDYDRQRLTGSYFDDTVISCQVREDSGVEKMLYLKTENGELIRSDLLNFTMDTLQSSYFATNGQEYIFGTVTGEPMALFPAEETVRGALPLNGAVAYTWGEDSLQLSFYDFATGKRTGTTAVSGVEEPRMMTADAGAIWFVAGNVLYRWDVTGSPAGDEEVYTGQYFTAEHPDRTGLEQCQTQALELLQTYGVQVYIWEEAAELTQEYTMDAEYRASVTKEVLDAITTRLKSFPQELLPTCRNVTFYLVQSLKNGEPSAIYRDGADCHVVLASHEAEKYFLWGVGFALDTHVLGNSREFDTWDELNPAKFKYTYHYETNAQRENWEKYMDCFVDQTSMSFPTEDRSRIFAWSMLPEGSEVFRKEDLQDKLERICEGIREAYDLEDSPVVFPWEQYLEKPLAKKK